MESKEILNFCLKKGFLLAEETLNLFSENDVNTIGSVIEKIAKNVNTKIITKNVLFENKELVLDFFSELPKEEQKKLENLKIKLGLSIEISKSAEKIKEEDEERKEKKLHNIKINSLVPILRKKIEVQDFVKFFKNRFLEMQKFIQEHPNLKNLVSINKIFQNSQVSIIGTVSNKKITKNGNILLELEDLTGKIKVLVTKNKKEVYEKAEDVCLDSVIGVKISKSREIAFANDIIFPDSALLERKKSPYEECVLFISDLHIGSKLFLEENFLKFVDYLNGKIPNRDYYKIKYLFIVGDIVAGIGVYPSQERDLMIRDIEEQYAKAAELLGKIRRDIAIIISPGNHDCTRLLEPQPLFDERYAWPLFNLKNVFLTGNPSYVNIGAKKEFMGFNVLTYHGFSFPYYANNISSLVKEDALNNPSKIMTYLLKNRHLAPTHSSVQYLPLEEDPFIIKKVPDIFVSAHTHKSSVAYYNNILTISCSCWESKTPFQEKMGNEPDFCKVPMLNLKTRQIKILDFE